MKKKGFPAENLLKSILIPVAFFCFFCFNGKAASGNSTKELQSCLPKLLESFIDRQLPDGAICMTIDSRRAWINPYFANLGGIAALKGTDKCPKMKQEILSFIEKWLVWYADHQLPDGAIYDYDGTPKHYVSANKYDSSDSYSATYLLLLYEYERRSGKNTVSPQLKNAALKAYYAMNMTMDDDGLTWAALSYKAKYLMDNLEVNQGLCAARALFQKWNWDSYEKDAEKRLERNTQGLDKYVLPGKPYLAWAVTGVKTIHQGFQVFYPDFMANAFAAAMIRNLKPEVWAALKKAPKVATALDLRVYTAALRAGDHVTAQKLEEFLLKRIKEKKLIRGLRLDHLTAYTAMTLQDPDYYEPLGRPGKRSPLTDGDFK